MTIYLAGEGWGNESAYKGLCKQFSDIRHITDITLTELKDETIVFAGYKPLVPYEVLYNNKCINVHYSLLPKYRGLHSTVWSILNDEDYLGLSIHLMTEFIDDGPIIHQYRIKNDKVKTSNEFMGMLNAYIADNLGYIIGDYLNGKIITAENDKSKATWVGKRNHQDCKVNFNSDLHYLQCFFRALVEPYPLPYVEYKGEELKITKVGFHPVNVDTHIGRILNIDNDGVWVKAKDGYLIIKELKNQNDDKVELSRFKIGQYFNS